MAFKEFELNNAEMVLNNLIIKNASLETKKRELEAENEKYAKILRSRQVEIRRLKESVKLLEAQTTSHHWKFGLLEPKFWQSVLPYLQLQDLYSLLKVSQFLYTQINLYLQDRNSWKRILQSHCKSRAWKSLIFTFRTPEFKGPTTEISPDEAAEIHRDVFRGIEIFHPEVESVLVALCVKYPDIGYCQGMQFVADFLLSVLQNSEHVLDAFELVMGPPYFMGEMWKVGFLRLKLVTFQLKQLFKMKMPALALHFKNVDLKLDVVVSSWLLTVFVSLKVQQNLPAHLLETIWDKFFVDGASVLISVSLALLNLSQESVIGKSLEETIDLYTSQLPVHNLEASIDQFQISDSLLEELSQAYYLLKE